MQWLSRFDISDTAIITVKNVGYVVLFITLDSKIALLKIMFLKITDIYFIYFFV